MFLNAVSAVFILLMLLCSCGGAEDVVRNVSNIVADPHVQMVKESSLTQFSDKKIGEAFDSFFSSPSWKYFVGTKHGTDEDGDGNPDSEEENVKVVEFTGKCTYMEKQVDVMIQFQISDDESSFEAAYMEMNELPQSTLMLYGMLNKVLGDEGGSDGNAAENGAQQQPAGDKKTYTVGDTAQTSAYRLTVQDFQDVSDKAGYNSGRKYVGVYIVMENISNDSITPTTSAYLDGFDIDDAYVSEAETFGVLSLDPGRKTKGFLCYDVTGKSWSELEVEFSIMSLANENKVILHFTPDMLSKSETEKDLEAMLEYDMADEEYIFPSDSALVTLDDLRGLSKEDVSLMRNEIYARHGYIFQSKELKEYFESKSWYTPNPNFSESDFSSTEKKNKETIIAYEKSQGWR